MRLGEPGEAVSGLSGQHTMLPALLLHRHSVVLLEAALD